MTQHNTEQHDTTQQGTTQHKTADRTQHDTTRHNTAQHSTAQHDTTRHNTAQHSTARHDTTRHDTTRHDTAQQNTHLRSDKVCGSVVTQPCPVGLEFLNDRSATGHRNGVVRHCAAHCAGSSLSVASPSIAKWLFLGSDGGDLKWIKVKRVAFFFARRNLVFVTSYLGLMIISSSFTLIFSLFSFLFSFL